jgi:copper transport protein
MRVHNDPAESVSPWRSLSRAAVVVAAAAALLLAPARPAAAHAVLSGSDPVNGASLSRVPAVVVLRFTENLVAGASSAQLVDGAGRPVAGAHLVAGSGRELTVRLPRLAAGSYAVVWRVSGVGDGHPTEGVLVFTVERSAAQAASVAAPGEPPVGPLDVVLRWLRLVLLGGLLGGLAMAGPVLAPVATGNPERLLATMARRIRRRVLAIALVCAGLAAVVTLANLAARPSDTLLLCQAAVFAAVVPVLLGMRPAVARPAAMGYPSPIGWWAVAALVCGACVLEAAGADAANVVADRVLTVTVTSARVLAGCLVLGLVGILAALLWPSGLIGARQAALVRSVRRPLVRLAVVSAATATAAGLYGAGRDLDSVYQLLHTGRGQLLLVQGGLVLAGGWLALSGGARLAGRRGPARARRSPSRRLLAAGLACALALLASGVLADSADAGEPTRAAAASPALHDGRLDDLVVSVSVVPDLPGVNGFTVQVASSRRPAPAPIERVALTYDGGTGTVVVPLAAIGSGRFFGTGTLGPAGVAGLVTMVRRSGADVSVPVEWPALGPPLSPQAVPGVGGLAGLLDVPAWVLAGLAIGLGAWWLVLSRHRWRVDV